MYSYLGFIILLNGCFATLPNIVLIVTDDQDLILNGMEPMEATIENIANNGVTFTNTFTSSPLCCPSRSSILSGQYSHNHGARNNSKSGGCYGSFWQDVVEERTIPTFLQAKNYNTFYAGKYLNQISMREQYDDNVMINLMNQKNQVISKKRTSSFDSPLRFVRFERFVRERYNTTGNSDTLPMMCPYVPAYYIYQYFSNNVPTGWNNWYGLHGNSRYHNFTLNENGNLKRYQSEYLTDVLANLTIDFILEQSIDQPFFAFIAPPAPHKPFTPAERHADFYNDVNALRTPNFNLPAKDILDKHWFLRMFGNEPFNSNVTNLIDSYYRNRWRSLLAVDELVNRTVMELDKNGLLNNTYIIYTSDNGFHLGQFALPFDKRQPYETDIRVPFMIRGPSIKPKSISNVPILLIDLFPTILEWAGFPKPFYLDGESFNKYLTDESLNVSYERKMLIEHWGEGGSGNYEPKCQWSITDNLAGCTLETDCRCQDSVNNTYSCIRHISHDLNKLYCEFNDNDRFVEAYDLYDDPYQMENLGYNMLPSERVMYNLDLRTMRSCYGQYCQLAV